MQSRIGNNLSLTCMSSTNAVLSTMLPLILLCLSFTNGVRGQFYADYGDGGGGSLYPERNLYSHSPHLTPFDIPVIYKHRSLPAAYPVAPTIYEMTLMEPIEPMPGKKTVPLYIVPEDALLLQSNRIRAKRSGEDHDHPHHPHHDHPGLRVNIKYPEFFGLTDGYHIPAVEIPLSRPMVVKQIEVNVLAPEGFMVPFQSEGRQWPYPMQTGCLVATIPRNTYVGDDNPITIRRLFAVPSLPQYPTHRPAFPSHSAPGYPHSHPHSHSGHDHGQDGVTLNFYPNGQSPNARHYPQIVPVPVPVKAPQPKGPVFELVPVTPKSSRRNGKRRKNGKCKNRDNESDEDRDRDRNRDRDSSDEDRDNDSDSRENSEENDRDRDRCRDDDERENSRRNRRKNRNRDKDRPRNRDRDNDRDKDRDRDSDRDRDRSKSTTERSTTTTRTTTPTTTTVSTTTPAASSIQDIIAAFSSFRDRERERDERRNRISASFYEDEERERDRSKYSGDRNRDRDRDRNEGLRGGDTSRGNNNRDEELTNVLRERERPRETPSEQFTPPPQQRQQQENNNSNRENSQSRKSSASSNNERDTVPSAEALQGLRDQVLQRQINQLQRLLGSLNLGQDSNSN